MLYLSFRKQDNKEGVSQGSVQLKFNPIILGLLQLSPYRSGCWSLKSWLLLPHGQEEILASRRCFSSTVYIFCVFLLKFYCIHLSHRIIKLFFFAKFPKGRVIHYNLWYTKIKGNGVTWVSIDQEPVAVANQLLPGYSRQNAG